MEKPGLVKTQWGRIKLLIIILSSCFLAGVIIINLLQFKKEKKCHYAAQ
jgi:hypothetical protein